MADKGSETTMSGTEYGTGPILSRVWALMLPNIGKTHGENWAIGISDLDGRNWTWWEMVSSESGGFESRETHSTTAPTTVDNNGPIYLGKIARLDAVQIGSTVVWEVGQRPEWWTCREFVFEIWNTLYEDDVVNKAEHDFGLRQLVNAFSR